METPATPHAPTLEFVVPHDGTQPEVPVEEQVLVAEKFKDVVQDLFLHFAADVEHYDEDEEFPVTSLSLELPVAGGGKWSIGIESTEQLAPYDNDFPLEERTVQGIRLEYILGGLPLDVVHYKLGGDEIVRRTGRSGAPPTLVSPLEPNAEDQDSAQAVEADMQEMVDFTVPNLRFAQSMGHQLQPIGMPELEGLEAFIKQPDVIYSPLPWN